MYHLAHGNGGTELVKIQNNMMGHTKKNKYIQYIYTVANNLCVVHREKPRQSVMHIMFISFPQTAISF